MHGAVRVLVVTALAAACAMILAAGCAMVPPSPSLSPAPTSAGPSGTAAGAEPPPAVLAINGAGRHEGELGSFTYRSAGSDAPWLPARTLESVSVRQGQRLTASFADGSLIGPWAATIAPAGDDQAERARAFGRDETVGGLRESVELPAPPAGSWVLMMQLEYGDGSGSGAYYWLVDVR